MVITCLAGPVARRLTANFVDAKVNAIAFLLDAVARFARLFETTELSRLGQHRTDTRRTDTRRSVQLAGFIVGFESIFGTSRHGAVTDLRPVAGIFSIGLATNCLGGTHTTGSGQRLRPFLLKQVAGFAALVTGGVATNVVDAEAALALVARGTLLAVSQQQQAVTFLVPFDLTGEVAIPAIILFRAVPCAFTGAGADPVFLALDFHAEQECAFTCFAVAVVLAPYAIIILAGFLLGLRILRAAHDRRVAALMLSIAGVAIGMNLTRAVDNRRECAFAVDAIDASTALTAFTAGRFVDRGNRDFHGLERLRRYFRA